MRAAVLSAIFLMALIGAVVHKQMRANADARTASFYMGAWELVPGLRHPSFKKSDIDSRRLNPLEAPKPAEPRKRSPAPKRAPMPA